MKKKRTTFLKYGTLLNFRFKITEHIGRGSFGLVYAAIDGCTLQEAAVKIESRKVKNSRFVLEVERSVMMTLQNSPYVVKFVESGKYNGLMFLVMERLGPDLSTLRKSQPNRRLNLCSTIRLGIQMVNAVESIHKMGFVHRDIKPSNFCIGRREGTRGQVFLIDFSLARRFQHSSTGKIKSPRRKVGFRGTSRFASVNAHRGLELYPRDDLWSVWYTIVELHLGKLPWEGRKDRDAVGKMKSTFHLNKINKYEERVPHEFDLIRQHLFSLKYQVVPDYDLIRKALVSLFHKHRFKPNQPYDWEDQKSPTSNNNSSPPPSSSITKNNNNKSPSAKAKQNSNYPQMETLSVDSSERVSFSSATVRSIGSTGSSKKSQSKKYRPQPLHLSPFDQVMMKGGAFRTRSLSTGKLDALNHRPHRRQRRWSSNNDDDDDDDERRKDHISELPYNNDENEDPHTLPFLEKEQEEKMIQIKSALEGVTLMDSRKKSTSLPMMIGRKNMMIEPEYKVEEEEEEGETGSNIDDEEEFVEMELDEKNKPMSRRMSSKLKVKLGGQKIIHPTVLPTGIDGEEDEDDNNNEEEVSENKKKKKKNKSGCFRSFCSIFF